ncbi:hypothetical protein NX722_09745 [Endozoicomonas gorgoniicola]|uniref:Urease alpha-subunit N-terminal domain-containing protein n=1 Tax=Endozoicomonas gorgoniicola TaxID=1234144 RepID=A0ABT3MU74_9GAMM|nr:hypothetical protein [Endozoicomonas gorgoniicola]MCW7552919.1 hypothetical protein [Endozoicomonas gorgoniicola]
MAKIDRRAYVDMYGPTVGDKVRLARKFHKNVADTQKSRFFMILIVAITVDRLESSF